VLKAAACIKLTACVLSLASVHGSTHCMLAQVDMAAAARAAVQRRAPPGSEATTLPGGSPIFAAVTDDTNKVLHEAMPPLQVSCSAQWKDALQWKVCAAPLK